MTLELAARLTTVIVMVAAVLGAFELLASPLLFRADGFYSWEVLRTGHRWALDGSRAKWAAGVFGPRGMQCVFLTQVVAAVLAISRLGPEVLWIAVVLAAHVTLHVRNTYGLDGSDQMQTIVLIALLVFHLAPNDIGKAIALGFVAAQSLLSYFSAGLAKLISPMWRDGTAISGVLDTVSYGNSLLTRIMLRHHFVAKALCWSTLLFECLMPLLVLTGPGGCLVFIAAGIAFHAGIAITMGLNLFLWSFAATYPCLYLLASWLS